MTIMGTGVQIFRASPTIAFNSPSLVFRMGMVKYHANQSAEHEESDSQAQSSPMSNTRLGIFRWLLTLQLYLYLRRHRVKAFKCVLEYKQLVFRGRQREKIMDGLATWPGPGKVSDILAAVKDRDLWRDMIANAYKQGT
ncbi:hypothetical protein PoB_004303200 [Plakobranchus ocellatus]|uniref:Uncharacterized protein n=1 Tax=Plakobranchus ocellatus TaxID=259542 RepID=A0AAV4BBJ1_9GAST|nr:hypothetical protein PoB_004303200 [Plakobranchus ocellatus]